MHEESLLRDLVILVGCAIPIVALAQRLRIQSVVGFLMAGIVIGPHGLGLIPQRSEVMELAEIGAVLLLFTIGLELSLSRLARTGGTVLRAGAGQVVGTVAAVAGVGLLLGLDGRRALFYGSLVALSSTAVVLKLYSERAELDTAHGRVAVAILLFQDLAVVPLMLLVPILANAQTGSASSLALAVVKSLAVVGALLAAGKFVIPTALDRVVLLKNRELFTLSVGFLGLGAAFVTARAGLSLALGSFLAGLAISESRHGLQALSDALPFRDAFAGVFFLSVGMLLDLRVVAASALLVIALTLGVLFAKAFIASLVVLTLPRRLQVSLTTGLRLAQVGEFSFVLAGVALPLGLFADGHYQIFISVSVLTLLLTPLWFQLAEPVSRLALLLRPREIEERPPEKQDAASLERHAIIVGFGLSGRHLARVLHGAQVPYVVIEQNGQLVGRARAEGIHVVFGDGTRRDVLEHVAASRASVIVFTISSPADERRGVAMASEVSPRSRKIVRTRHALSIEELCALGASDVVVEEFEATLELFARVLESYDVPTPTIYRELEAVRSEQYGFLRGQTDVGSLNLDKLRHLGIHSAIDIVDVEAGSEAVGESPATLRLRERTGAIVVAAVRSGAPVYPSTSGFGFQSGDTVVLAGDPTALARASQRFRSPAVIDPG